MRIKKEEDEQRNRTELCDYVYTYAVACWKGLVSTNSQLDRQETYSLQGCGDPHGRLRQKDLAPLDLALDARERYSSRGETRSSRIMVDVVLPTLNLQFRSEDA